MHLAWLEAYHQSHQNTSEHYNLSFLLRIPVTSLKLTECQQRGKLRTNDHLSVAACRARSHSQQHCHELQLASAQYSTQCSAGAYMLRFRTAGGYRHFACSLHLATCSADIVASQLFLRHLLPYAAYRYGPNRVVTVAEHLTKRMSVKEASWNKSAQQQAPDFPHICPSTEDVP